MPKYICHNCGSIDKITHQAQGTLMNELGVWLIAILDGPFTAWISIGIAVTFSLWRAMAKKKICNACREDALIAANTPRGKKLMDQYGHE